MPSMTKLLEEAINRLKELPESLQDSAARALIMQLEEEPEPGDLAAISKARSEIQHGDFVSLKQARHDVADTDR